MAEAGRVAFLGGNGHCPARLEGARAVLARAVAAGQPAFDLLDVPYPGFDGRPRVSHLDGLLDAVAAALRSSPPTLVYATGIGGMLALCLRARGELAGVKLVLQAPVLWGLEHRAMPRILRLGLARVVLTRVVSWTPFQARFARRHFVRTLSRGQRHAFFHGYARCSAAADLFDWIGPGRLRRLEADFRREPAALGAITVWWGIQDRVLTPRELAWTESALGVKWPLRVFPEWGHYPMIDDPEGWVAAVSSVLHEPR